MIKLRTFLFSFFLLQMGISHADSLEVEVKREGGGYINLSAREDESSRYCNIYTGALRITSLQYGNSDRPNKIEFTSASGDILVFDFNTDKMNIWSLSNAERNALYYFPERNINYFIKFQQCSGGNGGEMERHLLEMYKFN